MIARVALLVGCGIAAVLLANSGCAHGTQAEVPCAAPAVAAYTARMVKAGCTGAHFNDPQCAAIKEQRDAEEADGGCK